MSCLLLFLHRLVHFLLDVTSISIAHAEPLFFSLPPFSQVCFSRFSASILALLGVLLTFIGALCRWQLSRFNPRIPSFPLGTFAANILATITLGTMNLIQARVIPLPFTITSLSFISISFYLSQRISSSCFISERYFKRTLVATADDRYEPLSR